jgi:general secretion pathway protein J
VINGGEFEFESDAFGIGFVRSGWRNPDLRLRRSHLQNVAYYIDSDNRLLRRYWYHVDRFDASSYRDRLMVNDVVGLTFRFLTLQGEWESAWPPEDNTKDDFDELPVALEATIELEDVGSARRIYVLPN